jgi:hypothetical protein
MPRVLHDILTEVLGGETDMAVVGDLVGHDDLLAEVDRVKPQVVVLGLEGAEIPRTCELLFTRAPGVKIITIEDTGHRATLYELRPTRTLLGEPSLRGLLQLIRSATRSADEIPSQPPAAVWSRGERP